MAARLGVVEHHRFPEVAVDRFRREDPEVHPEDIAGAVCLRHLSGVEAPLRRTYDPRRDKPAIPPGRGTIGAG